MARKERSVTETLRAALQDSGQSLTEVSRRTAIDVGCLSRFIRRERGLSAENIDALADYLGLDLRPRK